MKKIVLIRHAEAAPAEAGQDDFERPLVPKGEWQSEDAGRILKDAGILPGKVFTSPAERALRTAAIIAGKTGFDTRAINQVPGLYNQMNGSDLSGLVGKIDNAVSVIFIVGHEPGISQFAQYFSPAFKSNFPKAGVLVLDFDIAGWDHVGPKLGVIALFDAPRSRRN
jgi:phosphohistidine phosphatase